MKRSDLIYAATFGSASKFALKAKRFLNSANIESSYKLSELNIRVLNRCDSRFLKIGCYDESRPESVHVIQNFPEHEVNIC